MFLYEVAAKLVGIVVMVGQSSDKVLVSAREGFVRLWAQSEGTWIAVLTLDTDHPKADIVVCHRSLRSDAPPKVTDRAVPTKNHRTDHRQDLAALEDVVTDLDGSRHDGNENARMQRILVGQLEQIQHGLVAPSLCEVVAGLLEAIGAGIGQLPDQLVRRKGLVRLWKARQQRYREFE